MIDRVTAANGLLGPVDEARAMAANILAVWNGNRAAMSEAVYAPCPPVQLGPQHGGFVGPDLPRCAGRPGAARWSAVSRCRALWRGRLERIQQQFTFQGEFSNFLV